ncbi:oxaloacetate decarboxylase [Actinoplanes sp. GCM10030250]|uniref:isocitrate lyase/PEP mutase family protein n=1 Tax=Actinoplanes sp. GCM10030250 TaxID=3273376 RepID=UPI00360A1812
MTTAAFTAAALRALLAADQVTHVPGVYDPITASLAVRAGHQAVHLSAAAVAAIALGRPDLGYAHATQIADRASTLVPALDGVPLLADADIGYSEPGHAVWTGLAYARAGVSGLCLDDRVGPKRWGEPVGKEVVSVALATETISALADQVPHLALIARTDAYAENGLAETVRRCRAYAGAGADAVHPEGVESLDELAALHRALPGVPIVISHSEAAGARPPHADADLARVGVRLVLHPLTALLAAVRAASLTYRAIAESGSTDSGSTDSGSTDSGSTELSSTESSSAGADSGSARSRSAAAVDRMPWAVFTTLTGQRKTADPDERYVPGNLQT